MTSDLSSTRIPDDLVANVTRFQVGDLEIYRILELEFPLGPAILAIGDDQEALVARCPWAQPHFVTETGDVVFALSAWALESQGSRIVIDPCGSFDLRRENPDIQERAAALLDVGLPAAGFPPESIDLVLNTHIDGVGWNVRPGPEGWRPAFPNARCVWATREIARISAGRDRTDDDERDLNSLRPLLEADLIEAVDIPRSVNAEVTMRPSPGHTAGNVDIWIESGGESAVVVGDHILNPLQCADPDWTGLDGCKEASPAIRRALLAECAERNTLILGPHFGSPGAGRVRPEGNAWRMDAEAPHQTSR